MGKCATFTFLVNILWPKVSTKYYYLSEIFYIQKNNVIEQLTIPAHFDLNKTNFSFDPTIYCHMVTNCIANRIAYFHKIPHPPAKLNQHTFCSISIYWTLVCKEIGHLIVPDLNPLDYTNCEVLEGKAISKQHRSLILWKLPYCVYPLKRFVM